MRITATLALAAALLSAPTISTATQPEPPAQPAASTAAAHLRGVNATEVTNIRVFTARWTIAGYRVYLDKTHNRVIATNRAHTTVAVLAISASTTVHADNVIFEVQSAIDRIASFTSDWTTAGYRVNVNAAANRVELIVTGNVQTYVTYAPSLTDDQARTVVAHHTRPSKVFHPLG